MKILNTRLTCLLLLTLLVLSNQTSLAKISKHSSRAQHRSGSKARRLNRFKSSLQKAKLFEWVKSASWYNITETAILSAGSAILAGMSLTVMINPATALAFAAICAVSGIFGVVIFHFGSNVAYYTYHIMWIIWEEVQKYDEENKYSRFTEVSSSISKNQRSLSHRHQNTKFSKYKTSNTQLMETLKKNLPKTLKYKKKDGKTIVLEGTANSAGELILTEENEHNLNKKTSEELILIGLNIKQLECLSAQESGMVRLSFKLSNKKTYENLAFIQMLRIQQMLDSNGKLIEEEAKQKKLFDLKSEQGKDTQLSFNIFKCQDKNVGYEDRNSTFEDLAKLFASLKDTYKPNGNTQSKNPDFTDIMEKEQITEEIQKLSDGTCCHSGKKLKRRRHRH